MYSQVGFEYCTKCCKLHLQWLEMTPFFPKSIARVSCVIRAEGWYGTDVAHGSLPSYLLCQEVCQNTAGCQFIRYTNAGNSCNLVMSSLTSVLEDQGNTFSGPAVCDQGGCLKTTEQLDNPSVIDEIEHVRSAEICQWLCVQEPLCGAFNYFRGFHASKANACQLLPAKDTFAMDRSETDGVISGPKIC